MFADAIAIIEDESQRNELSEFYEENKNRFYAIAFSNVHNKTDAEDAVQEAFLRIVKKPELFFTKSWNDRILYTSVIVRNVSADIYLKNYKYKCDNLTDDIEDDCLPLLERTVGELSRDELMRFIASLSEALRQALLLKIHYQMTTSEIASALGISETAARKRISDAGKKIRRFMEANENE